MKELGILNRGVSKFISEKGHHDLLMVCDVGFAKPKDVEFIDISMKENQPRVVELLFEKKNFPLRKSFWLTRQKKPIHHILMR